MRKKTLRIDTIINFFILLSGMYFVSCAKQRDVFSQMKLYYAYGLLTGILNVRLGNECQQDHTHTHSF